MLLIEAKIQKFEKFLEDLRSQPCCGPTSLLLSDKGIGESWLSLRGKLHIELDRISTPTELTMHVKGCSIERLASSHARAKADNPVSIGKRNSPWKFASCGLREAR